MKRFFMIAMIFMAILSACETGASPTPIADTLFVDPHTDLGPISPYLFGTNYGPMHAVPMDVLPLVEEAGFTALRFPGGAWTDTADMKPFQIDQLMAFAKQVDAEDRVYRLLRGIGFFLWHPAMETRNAQGGFMILDGIEEFREHLGGELSVTMLRAIGRGEDVHNLEHGEILKAMNWLRNLEAGR